VKLCLKKGLKELKDTRTTRDNQGQEIFVLKSLKSLMSLVSFFEDLPHLRFHAITTPDLNSKDPPPPRSSGERRRGSRRGAQRLQIQPLDGGIDQLASRFVHQQAPASREGHGSRAIMGPAATRTVASSATPSEAQGASATGGELEDAGVQAEGEDGGAGGKVGREEERAASRLLARASMANGGRRASPARAPESLWMARRGENGARR